VAAGKRDSPASSELRFRPEQPAQATVRARVRERRCHWYRFERDRPGRRDCSNGPLASSWPATQFFELARLGSLATALGCGEAKDLAPVVQDGSEQAEEVF